jgi:hypothetical protein
MQQDVTRDGNLYIPIDVAAQALNRTKPYLMRLCRSSDIRGLTIDGEWFVDSKQVTEFVGNQEAIRAKQYESIKQQRAAEYQAHQNAAMLHVAPNAMRLPIVRPAPMYPMVRTVVAAVLIGGIALTAYASVDQRAAQRMAAVVRHIPGMENLLAFQPSVNSAGENSQVAAAENSDSSSAISRFAQAWAHAVNGIFAVFTPSPITATNTIRVAGLNTITAATSTPAPIINQTIVQQPVIEHTIETRTIVSEPSTQSGISESSVEEKIQELDNKLSARMYSLTSANSNAIAQNYVVTAQSNAINQLINVTITNPVISGGTISGASISVGSLSVSNTATSSFASGIDLTAGCFSMNGVCIGSNAGTSNVSTSTVNTWSAIQIFAAGAQFGGVSSTTIDSNGNVAVGGTISGAGLSACAGSGDKLLWDATTQQFTCGVDAGGSGSGISAIRGQYSSPQVGATQTFATTTDTNIGLTITSAGNIHTFSPTWTGSLAVNRGGTGTTTAPTYGQLLLGNASGGYNLVATSSLGITNIPTWGTIAGTLSNQTDLQAALDAKLALANWYSTTTDALAQGSVNKYYSTNLFAGSLAGTTTDALAQGSTNKYYSDTAVDTRINASSTIAKTSLANIWNPLQTFTNGFISNASSTIAGNFTTTGTITTALGTAAGAFLAVDPSGHIIATTTPSGGSGGGSGTVTSVVAGTGLSGGTITSTGTISLNLANANTWSALQLFSAGASSTNFSNFGTAYFGGTATTTIDSAGNITLPTGSFRNRLLYTDSNATVTGMLCSSGEVVVNTGSSWGCGSPTGTGFIVKSVSPALTGTLSAAAANFSGNVGIGTTSPWKMLSVAGDIIGTNITATGTITTSLGSAAGAFLAVNPNGQIIATTTPGGGGAAIWGSITGTLSSQSDLQTALDARLTLTNWYATTTDALAQGSINKYWSNILFDNRLSATSSLANLTTLANLATVGTITSGTWSGLFGAVSGANLTNLTAANISAGTAAINVTGNAGTATKLAATKNINNVAFDGSADITISAASSTLLANNNTFSGVNTFTGNTTFANATTTNIYSTTASSTNLFAQSASFGTIATPLGIPAGSFLAVNPSGQVIATTTPTFSAAWGSITGTLSNQTDLQTALNAKLSLSAWYATTTDGLAQGSTNFYFSTTSVNSVINASTTIPKTAAANTWTQLQTFASGFVSQASSTVVGVFTASSFNGNGSALTSLTAANISAGTAGINISGNAATVTTNANLTGAVTSSGNSTSLGSFSSSNLSGALSDETGGGAVVFAASPTFTGKITLAAASTTDLSVSSSLYVPFASAVHVSDANNKTTAASAQTCTNQFVRAMSAAYVATCATVSLTADVTGTLGVGNGGTGITSFGTGIATFLGTPSSANLAAALTDETGTGSAVFSASPTFTGKITLAAASSTDLTVSSSLYVPFASAVHISDANNKTIAASAQTCTNQFIRSMSAAYIATCATVSLTADVTGTLGVGNGGTGITSFGTGIATWLGTPSSANLLAALTDETGTGAAVFAASPTLTGTLTAATANFSGLNTLASGFVSQASSTVVGNFIATGSVGIGMTATNKLDVNGAINAVSGYKVNGTAGITGTNTLSVNNCAVTSGSLTLTGGLVTASSQYVVADGPCDGDIAERYGTEETIVRGEIVALGTSTNSRAFTVGNPDQGESTTTPYTITTANVRKATADLRSQIMGAVPTAPKMIGEDVIDPKYNPQAVALVGHVPIKMTLDGGPVAIGDPITVSSSTPGAGMKATTSGRIIGWALESYIDPSASDDGMIEVYVKPQDWIAPPDYTALLSLSEFTSATSSTIESGSFMDTFLKKIFAQVSAWFADAGNGIGNIYAQTFHASDQICVDDQCLTKDDIRRLLQMANAGSSVSSPPVPPGPDESPEPDTTATSTPDSDQLPAVDSTNTATSTGE